MDRYYPEETTDLDPTIQNLSPQSLRSQQPTSQPCPVLDSSDPETMWSSFEYMAPDPRPEWIRLDLPVETEISSVELVSSNQTRYGNYGKALPKQLEVKTSRDAAHWETVYANKEVRPNQPALDIKFKPRRAKQIWVIGENFPLLTAGGAFGNRYAFSIGKLEVRDPAGHNLALVSRGASVTVSSTSYVQLNDWFTQNALWGPRNYDLGNKWVRIGGDNGSFMWHYVEHEKGKLQIDPAADESVTQLVRHGIQVILNLDWKGNWIYMNPPRKTNWTEARLREINDAYSDGVPAADENPEMYQGYVRYIEYMVQHFKDRVSIFETGNEWNASFGYERYMEKFFEPAYKIIKRVAPNAKVMLGSPAGLDRQAILGCLGMKWKSGIAGGKLLLDAAIVADNYWLPERLAGAFAIRPDTRAKDVTVSVDALNKGQPAVVLRFKDVNNYLVPLYSAADHSISFYEVKDGNWGKPLASKKAPEFGPEVKLTAKVQGPVATFTVSDGKRNVSTSQSLERSRKPNSEAWNAATYAKYIISANGLFGFYGPYIDLAAQCPGDDTDVARVWLAPKSGHVQVKSTVSLPFHIGAGMERGFKLGPTRYAPWYALLDNDSKDGILISWDYFGHWTSSFDVRKDGDLSVKLVATQNVFLAPGKTITTPQAIVGVFRDDLDEAGNEFLGWQYGYMWDYTRDRWFPGIRMLGSWNNSTQYLEPEKPWSSDLATDVESITRMVFRTADLIRYSGGDVYHTDWGWFDKLGDWNGPDWRAVNRYLAKSDIGLLIYTWLYAIDPQSNVATEHPEWLMAGNGGLGRNLDLSQPEVVAYLEKQLDIFYQRWGDFEWRNDGHPLLSYNGDDETPFLEEDQIF